MKESKFISIFIGGAFVLLLVLAFSFNGTGDSGDSITHYLFARYAFTDHNNFYDTWAKPLYVLLAAPFAQLGFTGIKIFNILNTILSMVATYLIAKRLNMASSWLVPVLLLLSPLNFALSLSGLTEPLFASMLITGLCLLLYEYSIAGLILLSFIPFLRSEGMFLLIIIAAYLIREKKYKSIVLLFTGQFVYALAGYFHSGSLLWFYQSNPYSVISKYGHGAFNTYFINMPLIAGPASCLLLGIGFICLPLGTFKAPAVPSRFLLLIWVLFAAYFFFHVISWTFGLFSSLGLPRTINGIMPLMIILCLYGYNQLGVLLKMKFKNHAIIYNYTAILIIGINLVFMVVKFAKHNGSWLELMPTTDELVENKITDYIKQKYTDYNNRQIIYHAPYLSVLLNIDPTSTVRNTSPNKLYIWDDWYSVVEGGITLDMLRKDTTLVYDTTFTMLTSSGKARSVALFRSK